MNDERLCKYASRCIALKSVQDSLIGVSDASIFPHFERYFRIQLCDNPDIRAKRCTAYRQYESENRIHPDSGELTSGRQS